MTIESFYEKKCAQTSDINEHLPTLRHFAEKCDHVTEMGVRDVVSTWALLAAHPKELISYDISDHPNIRDAEFLAAKEGVVFRFVLGDTRTIEIEETDFLFIDTLHTYEQLTIELARHGNKARKYLGFHDTTIFANQDEDGRGKGLWTAIEEFMAQNPHWQVKERFVNNNGLTILERKS